MITTNKLYQEIWLFNLAHENPPDCAFGVVTRIGPRSLIVLFQK